MYQTVLFYRKRYIESIFHSVKMLYYGTIVLPENDGHVIKKEVPGL